MKNEKKTGTTGLSVNGLLLVAFVVLKLCGVINWSWWWVLSPIWIPIALWLICAAAAIIIELAEK